jgi:Zn-dependent protease with chaperone function
LTFLFTSARAKAQAPADSRSDTQDGQADCDPPGYAYLSIDADRRGFAHLFLSLCLDRAREDEVGQEIATALECPKNRLEIEHFTDKGFAGMEANCTKPLSRRGLDFTGRADVRAIQELLKKAGVSSLAVIVALPSNGDARCSPAPRYLPVSAEVVPCAYSLSGQTGDPQAIEYAFGYSAAQAGRIVGSLGLLLLLPVAITLWLRRRALSVGEEAREAVWFSYFRFLRWMTLGGTLVWWTGIDLLRADALVGFLLPSWASSDAGLAAMLPWIALWFLYGAVYALCVFLSSPIQSLRGIRRTRAEAVWQSLWSVGRLLIPFSLFALAIAELIQSPRVAILLFIAMFVAARLGARKLAQVYGMEPHALTSGELRDRAFAMAKKAGAKLNQLYVLPTERLRMANAFAHIGHNIFLTDYLLKNLSKREVDAVIGHEVAHLQKKHLRGRLGFIFGAIVVLSFASAWTNFRLPRTFPSGPILYAIVLLALFFVSRRNEFAADAGAVRLTEDPQPMMTALAKISRLNTMPMHWGRLEEKMLTHPSTLRRITRLARMGGIAEEQIPDLLRDSARPPAETYAIPSTAAPEGKIFSTRYKSRHAARLGWTMIFAGVSIPAAVALAAERAHLQGSTLWLAYAAGLVLAPAATLLLLNFAAPHGLRGVERGLREKCEKDGVCPEICRGLFVGLAPHSRPRIYEGNWNWDAGLLCLTPGELCYWGEETKFLLRRNEITRISVGPGAIGWFKAGTASISWRNAAGEERSFRLSAAGAGSIREMVRSSILLARDLDLWHRGLPLAPDPIVRPGSADSTSILKLGPPRFGSVTNTAPKELARGRFLARDFLINTFLAIGAIVLFGLRLVPLEFPAASQTLRPTGWSALYVLVVVWLNRAFLFSPFWRSREDKIQ